MYLEACSFQNKNRKHFLNFKSFLFHICLLHSFYLRENSRLLNVWYIELRLSVSKVMFFMLFDLNHFLNSFIVIIFINQ